MNNCEIFHYLCRNQSFNMNMKNYNLLLLLFFVCGSAMKVHSCPLSESRVSEQISVYSADSLAEVKPYFIYQIVSFDGGFKYEGVKVRVDNGESIKKLKDKHGENIVFKTLAAALMYFLNEGWELYINGSTVSTSITNEIRGNYSNSYWIFRKPCSREELDTVVKKGLMSESDLY